MYILHYVVVVQTQDTVGSFVWFVLRRRSLVIQDIVDVGINSAL